MFMFMYVYIHMWVLGYFYTTPLNFYPSFLAAPFQKFTSFS